MGKSKQQWRERAERFERQYHEVTQQRSEQSAEVDRLLGLVELLRPAAADAQALAHVVRELLSTGCVKIWPDGVWAITDTTTGSHHSNTRPKFEPDVVAAIDRVCETQTDDLAYSDQPIGSQQRSTSWSAYT